MKSLQAGVVLAALAVALAWAPLASADVDERLVANLRSVTQNGYQAYETGNYEEALRYIHTKSPEYGPTQAKVSTNPGKNLDFTVVDFTYIGHDDEFAVARVKSKTTGGPGFQDNVVDSIALFKQENGTWKFWADYILGVEFIDE